MPQKRSSSAHPLNGVFSACLPLLLSRFAFFSATNETKCKLIFISFLVVMGPSSHQEEQGTTANICCEEGPPAPIQRSFPEQSIFNRSNVAVWGTKFSDFWLRLPWLHPPRIALCWSWWGEEMRFGYNYYYYPVLRIIFGLHPCSTILLRHILRLSFIDCLIVVWLRWLQRKKGWKGQREWAFGNTTASSLFMGLLIGSLHESSPLTERFNKTNTR